MSRLLIIFFFISFLSACYPDFENPLSQIQDQAIDQNLLGQWRCDAGIIEITPSSNTGLIKILSRLDTDSNEVKKIKFTKEENEEKEKYFAYTSYIGKHTYLNLINKSDSATEGKTFEFFRYSIKNKILNLYMLNEIFWDDFRNKIVKLNDGRLQNRETKHSRYILTTATSDLYQYIYNNHEKIFILVAQLTRHDKNYNNRKIKKCYQSHL